MAVTTAAKFNFVGGHVRYARATKAAQNDDVIIPDPGALVLGAIQADGTAETITYNTIQAAAVGAVGATSLAYDTATANLRTAGGYYIKNTLTGEIIYVKIDSAPGGTSGTISELVRGALGTTEATIADDTPLIVLNSLNLGGTVAGPVDIIYMPLPNDPGVDLTQ